MTKYRFPAEIGLSEKEIEILGPIPSKVIHANRDLWQGLKEDISSFGNQSSDYYSSYEEFTALCATEIRCLSEDLKSRLIQCWKEVKRLIKIEKDQAILDQYGRCVAEVIVHRASKAAYYL